MKPIKKGMTEAITRDGRKVTQLTWFEEVENECPVRGVLDGRIHSWKEDGEYGFYCASDKYIFAIPEYEYKVLYKDNYANYKISINHYKSEEEFIKRNKSSTFIQLIEDLKRECD